MKKIKLENKWAWPTRWPTSKVGHGTNGLIRRCVSSFLTAGGKNWVDPMCGRSTLAEIRNDFRIKDTASQTHEDALAFLEKFKDGTFDGAIYDPPYNDAQGKKYSNNHHTFSDLKYWWSIRRELARVVKGGGKIIMLNWNSNGFTNFKLEAIQLFAHGSERHDTILTVWKKSGQNKLFS